MICTVITGPSFQEAQKQIEASIHANADLVELRLDSFTSLNIKALEQLRISYSIPMIFTLKNHKSPKEILPLNPEFIDLELDNPFIAQVPPNQLILSYHNFTHTPQDLDIIYEEMLKTPAAFYKIAVQANHTIEALRLLCWIKKKNDKKIIAISMGKQGQISRILAPVMGCPFTYASLDKENTLGQLPIQTLLKQYHHKQLNPQTALYGLIGDPVEQSISNYTHNAFIRVHDQNAVYIKMQIDPLNLLDFFRYAKELDFKGLSVTMPLKEEIMPYLDVIDTQALRIGAVNTIKFEHGKTIGYNTDGMGALNAIEKKKAVRGKQIVILGAGGTAKAIAYEAKKRGAFVTLVNRNQERAQKVAERLECRSGEMQPGYDILINSTPVKMPIVEDKIQNALIMDVGIKSKESPFLQTALNKGCPVVHGIEMFKEQALGQYAIWKAETQLTNSLLQGRINIIV